jgi:mono/diheme cytochrome c family protein
VAPFLFVGFWIVIGLVLAFVAGRGGPRGARETLQTQSRRGQKTFNIAFALIFVGLGIAVPVLILTGNHDNASAHFSGVALNAEDRHGRDAFNTQCASCHTLHAAHANGKVGPNLDLLRPPKALILDALAHGRTRGNGTMPAGLVQGTDAQAVADFVAKVAGH